MPCKELDWSPCSNHVLHFLFIFRNPLDSLSLPSHIPQYITNGNNRFFSLLVHLNTEIKNTPELNQDSHHICQWFLDPQSGVMDDSRLIVNGKIIYMEQVKKFIQQQSQDVLACMKELAPGFPFQTSLYGRGRIVDQLTAKEVGYSLIGKLTSIYISLSLSLSLSLFSF